MDHKILTPSPPNKTNLYVGAPIEIEVLGKKRVQRPATALASTDSKIAIECMHVLVVPTSP